MSRYRMGLSRQLAERAMRAEVQAVIENTDEPFDDGAGGNVPGPSTTVTVWARLEANGGAEGITEDQLRTLGRYTLHIPVGTLVRSTSTIVIAGKSYSVIALPTIDGAATAQPVGITEVPIGTVEA